jgi:hypothetical protein
MSGTELNKDHMMLIDKSVRNAFAEALWEHVETFSRGNSPLYTSSVRKVNLLSQERIEILPSYLEFMNSIGSGEVNLSDGQCQQQLGFIYLKMVNEACSSEAFKNSIARLKNKSQ